MPCNCGHMSCLCGIPCLCDESKCKCQDCAIAVGRVCIMCDKPFYYESLILRQKQKEEVCDCFMVPSTLNENNGINSTLQTNCTNSPADPSIERVDVHADPDIIEYCKLIPEPLDVQNSDPFSTNNSESGTLEPQQGQSDSVGVSKFSHLTNNDMSSTNHSESIITHERNHELSVQDYSNAMNNSPSRNQIASTISELIGGHLLEPLNIRNDFSNLETSRPIPEVTRDIYILNNPNYFTFQSMHMNSDHPIELNGESFDTTSRNTFPTFVPRNNSFVNSGDMDPEWEGATLRWLERLPNMELPPDYNN